MVSLITHILWIPHLYLEQSINPLIPIPVVRPTEVPEEVENEKGPEISLA